jgi:hypothetical protein
LGCTSSIIGSKNPNNPIMFGNQAIYNAPTVFGYFSPDHKAPESLIPAPEQTLLTSNSFNGVAGSLTWQLDNPEPFLNAGCDLALFREAAKTSDEHLLQLVNMRFFKGAMPQPLREGAKNLFSQVLNTQSPDQKVGQLISILITTPTYGVVK